MAVALAGAAVAAGVVAAGRGDEPSSAQTTSPATRTTTRTTTRTAPLPPPRTVVETVTQEVPVTPPAAPPDDTPAPSGADAVALTDRSTAALEDGDSATGLALAEQALTTLADTGEPYEGNARYNAGRALIDLGRCDEAVPQLERSVAVGGSEWQLGVRRAALREAGAC